MVPWLVSRPAILLLCIVFGGLGLVESHTAQIVIDAYPNTGTAKWGTTLVLVCRVVGVPSTTVLSYQWTCPGGSCDAGAVDPEWAARVQQGNILVVNVRNGNDGGNYTCTVVEGDSQQVGIVIYSLSVPNGLRGLSLINEDGGLKVFFPSNSFVTNTTLTHTNSPRGESQGAPRGNDHIVCYGMSEFTTRVIWRNSSGGELEDCGEPCRDCGGRCVRNGGVGVDSPLLRFTHIHMYTNSTAYVNQDLECRLFGGASSSIFIGVYLKNGVNTALQLPSSITQGAATTTTVSVSWSPVSGATGYYVSYQRQDLGAPPVVTPQYEKIVGGASTSVTLSGLEPGITYRIRVWSTDGTSVSSEAGEMDVTTVESAPTPLRMLTTAGNTTSSSVELNWLPPLHPNGAIHYEIEYEPAMSPGDTVNAGNSSTPQFTLTLPNEFVTYNVRVAAVNTQGLGSVQSINISVCLGRNREEGPDSPTGVTVEANGCDSATVSWNQTQSRICDDTIVGYSLRYQLSGGSDYTTVNTSGTSVTLEGLAPNADYAVSVAATNSVGDLSAYSAVISFSITDPTPPSGVSATVTGCDSAEVTWMASISMFGETIMNYSVTYQRTSGGVLTTVNSPSTSATLQGLVPNAEYNVSVAGINSCGGTSPYISTMFTLQGPAPPTGVSVVTGTECNTVDVSWSPSTVNYNAVVGNYSVRYRLRGSSGCYTAVYSTTTSITLQGLYPGAEYDVEVSAVDLCGRMSGFSEVASLDLQAPVPPTDVSVRDGGDCYTSVVSWAAPQTMCGVVIGNYSVGYQLKNGGGNYITVHSPTTSVTLQGLVPNTEYTVAVAAINSAGTIGSFTELAQFDLQEPKAPTEVLINAIGVDSVMVSWTASQSSCDDVIANYTVMYRLRDSTGVHTTVNTATTSVAIYNLLPDAEYTVSVAAINSMGYVSVYSAATLFVVNMATAPVTIPISPSGPTATPAGTDQVSGCVDVPIAAGAAAASFVGGVLLTTVIAAAVAGAILCRAKRKVTQNLVHSANILYEDHHPDMECNPAYVVVNKKVEDDQFLQSIPRCDTYI